MPWSVRTPEEQANKRKGKDSKEFATAAETWDTRQECSPRATEQVGRAGVKAKGKNNAVQVFGKLMARRKEIGSESSPRIGMNM